MDRGRQRCIAIVSGVWLFGALFVLGGGVAFADVVPDVTQAVDDPVDGVTQVVVDPVDEVTQVVVDPVDEVTQAVDDPVDGVTQAVVDTVDGVTQATSNTANGAASAAGPARVLGDRLGGWGRAKGVPPVRDREAGGSARPRTRTSADRPSPGPVGAVRPSRTNARDRARDHRLERLDRSARAGGADRSRVSRMRAWCVSACCTASGSSPTRGWRCSASSATTGAAVIGLMMLAAGLAVAGAWALVAATSTQAGAAGRAV